MSTSRVPTSIHAELRYSYTVSGATMGMAHLHLRSAEISAHEQLQCGACAEAGGEAVIVTRIVI